VQRWVNGLHWGWLIAPSVFVGAVIGVVIRAL
jgi:hypothetical protein